MNLDSYRDYDVVKFAIFIRRLKEVKGAFSNFKRIIGKINTAGGVDKFHINFVKIINVLDQNGLNNFVKFISWLDHDGLEKFEKIVSSIYVKRNNLTVSFDECWIIKVLKILENLLTCWEKVNSVGLL